MKGCIVPSEIGFSPAQSSTFGRIAEDIILADYVRRYPVSPNSLYVDNYNRNAYIYFLIHHNPHLELIIHPMIRVWGHVGIVRPDFLIHTPLVQEYYEIKPDSDSGYEDGVWKLGTLSATYRSLLLLYRLGSHYQGTSILVASYGSLLRAYLTTRLKGPGFITYQLCLECNGIVQWASFAAILRYIISEILKQQGKPQFRPIDLAPAFAKAGQLAKIAAALGLTMVVVKKIPWRFFWRAVAKRFAARGALAALLSAADGPLPFGELASAGMALWTIVDVIRLSDVLWTEAVELQRTGA